MTHACEQVFRHGESQWQAAPEIVVSAVGQQPMPKKPRATVTAVFADSKPKSSRYSSSGDHKSGGESAASSVTEVTMPGETQEDFPSQRSASDTATSAGLATEPSVLSEREMAAIEEEEAARAAEVEALNNAALLEEDRRIQEIQEAAKVKEIREAEAAAEMQAAAEADRQAVAEASTMQEEAASAEAKAAAEQEQARERIAREKEELHAARVAKAAALYSTKATAAPMTSVASSTNTATTAAAASAADSSASTGSTSRQTSTGTTNDARPSQAKPSMGPTPAPISLLSLLGRIRVRGSLVAMWQKWWRIEFSLAGALAIAGALALVLFAVIIAALALEALFRFLAVKVPEAANAMSPASLAVARAAGREGPSPRKGSSRATTEQQTRDSDQSTVALAAHQQLELANLRRTVFKVYLFCNLHPGHTRSMFWLG